MIKGLSRGLLLGYLNFGGSKKITKQELFINLSVSLGGDGSKITKAQLNSYIQRAESGSIHVGQKKLELVKTLSKDWDNLFGKKDEITVDDFDKAAGLFIAILLSEDENDKKEDDDKKTKKKSKIKEFFDELKKAIQADEKGVTKNQLQEYLNKLINQNSEKEDNSTEIDFITNLISDFDLLSNGQEHLASIKDVTEYQDISKIETSEFLSPIDFKI